MSALHPLRRFWILLADANAQKEIFESAKVHKQKPTADRLRSDCHPWSSLFTVHEDIVSLRRLSPPSASLPLASVAKPGHQSVWASFSGNNNIYHSPHVKQQPPTYYHVCYLPCLNYSFHRGKVPIAACELRLEEGHGGGNRVSKTFV